MRFNDRNGRALYKFLLSVLLLSACNGGDPPPVAPTPMTTIPPAPPPMADRRDVVIGSQLQSGFDLGLNTSGGRTDWLTDESGQFRMDYPSRQDWGTVFITVGPPKSPPRPFLDFSAFDTLVIEMKGLNGGETLKIGIKTNTQPDDGMETLIERTVTSTWDTYAFALSDFEGADPARLYVVTEFVFSGRMMQTVFFRNVRFTGSP